MLAEWNGRQKPVFRTAYSNICTFKISTGINVCHVRFCKTIEKLQSDISLCCKFPFVLAELLHRSRLVSVWKASCFSCHVHKSLTPTPKCNFAQNCTVE